MVRPTKGYARIERRPWRKAAVSLLAIIALGYLFAWVGWLRPAQASRAEIEAAIRNAASESHLPEALIWALVKQESKFNPDAKGAAGEVGLMQITSGAIADWASAHGRVPPSLGRAFAVDLNLRIGCWYLARAHRRWRHREDALILALYEYNAGRSRVNEWLRESDTPKSAADVPIASSRAYISAILQTMEVFQGPNEPAAL